MVKNYFTLFLVLSFMVMSCKEAESEQSVSSEDSIRIISPVDADDGGGFLSYTGVDMYGQERSCIDQFGAVCSDKFLESDQYALDCEENGDFPVQCGCHDWICVTEDYAKKPPVKDKLFGYDLTATLVECPQFDSTESICTEVFTEEDQFAMDCRDAGYTATQCGCHTWVCSEMP